MQLILTPAKLTAPAAQRLQACIHAVELAFANSIALDSVLKVVYSAKGTATPIYGYFLPCHEDAMQEH